MAVQLKSASRIAAVDGLRGLSAVGIICLHAWYGSAQPWPGSHAGLFATSIVAGAFVCVDFFFVISGFVLFLPTCLNRGDFGPVKPYAVRRAARIVPMYWFSLVVLVLALPLLTTEPAAFEHRGTNLALHLTFLQHTIGLAAGLREGFVVNGVVWTLTLEVIYYVMLPLVARAFYRRPALWTAIFFAVSIGWRYWVTRLLDPDTTDGASEASLILIAQIPTYLPHFALGMSAAWIYARTRGQVTPTIQRIALAMLTVGVVGIGWGTHLLGVDELMKAASPYSHQTRTMPVVLCFTLVLLGAVLGPAWARRPFDNRVIRPLGDISLSLYLWHLMVLGLAITTLKLPLGGFDDFITKLAFVLGVTVAVSWLTYLLIERPAMRWARNRTSRSRGTEPREGSQQLA